VTAVPETDEFDSGEAVARVAQPRQLIVTVYGFYSRREGGWWAEPISMIHNGHCTAAEQGYPIP
jgi:hypothetical protein